MIFAESLPRIKAFLRPARLAASTQALLVCLVAAFCCHPGGRLRDPRRRGTAPR